MANKVSMLLTEYTEPRLLLCSKASKEALAEKDEATATRRGGWAGRYTTKKMERARPAKDAAPSQVLLHDCKPLFRDEAEHPMPPGVTFWNGTVWKAVAALRADPTLDVIVGDFDWGLGIVRAAPNTRLLVLHVPFAEIPWEDYERGWRDILRPSTMAEVDRWLGGMARI